MSSIPNSAMPHAKPSTFATDPVGDSRPDRAAAWFRAVPTAAWLAGAAAIGVAGVTALAGAWGGASTGKGRRAHGKKRRTK